MSKIIKNWFYIIDENHGNQIYIEKNIYASFFIKNLENDLVINLEENAKLDLYSFFYDKSPKNILINQLKDNSILKLNSLFLNNKSDLISNISSYINSNNSTSNLNIISIVKENKIEINSNIEIKNDCKNINASLKLENIFIWKKWIIISNPNLFIDTNDIKVSHSSKTHRIEENKLFYLKSRWLNQESSIKLIIDSYFRNSFACLEMFDKKLFDELTKDFLLLNEKIDDLK